MIKVGIYLCLMNCFMFTMTSANASQIKDLKPVEKFLYIAFAFSGAYSMGTILALLKNFGSML